MSSDLKATSMRRLVRTGYIEQLISENRTRPEYFKYLNVHVNASAGSHLFPVKVSTAVCEIALRQIVRARSSPRVTHKLA